jgi:hypothetical protein
MRISYEFEGHYLPDWAEFGGLPCLLQDIHNEGLDYSCRLLCHDDGYWYVNQGEVCPKDDLGVKLLYSTLEDVLPKKPKGTKWFSVLKSEKHRGVGVWTDCEDTPIEGHLFNPEQYPSPINVEEVKE